MDIITHEKLDDDAEAERLFAEYIKEKTITEEEEKKKSLENDIRLISSDPGDNDNPKGLAYFTFENFIVGDANKFAYAACYAIATSDEVNYNPLFIHGKSGLGKTHLMYAIINRLFKRDPNLRVVYIRGEEFTNHLIEAIKNGTTEQFREKYRTADILLVDDIQFIAGKNATQDEFFHTFNVLYEAQKQIIVTCDRQIREMKNLEERIRTRLEWGISADIQPPDTELRMAIIRKKAEEYKLSLSEDIVEYLAERLRGNVRRIEGGVKKLRAMQFFEGKKITLDLARAAIADFVPEEEPEHNKIEKTLDKVCDRYNISRETILGKKRSANVVLARHTCMYILREGLEKTYEEIGAVFSCDHTTVMAAIRKIREMPDFSAAPVLMLTAKDREMDIVQGLDNGADDYMTKPFGILELSARVRNLLKRVEPAKEEVSSLTIGEVSINRETREVIACGDRTELTLKEFELLTYLMEHINRVVTRDELLDHIWGYDYDGETRTLDMHIKTLRQKLHDAGTQIKTVRGVGYRFLKEKEAGK